jgi:hypothetical protein
MEKDGKEQEKTFVIIKILLKKELLGIITH